MPKLTSRSVPTITVKNTTNIPQPIKSKVNGDTITIMPKATTQIHAHFATGLPNGAVRKIS